MARLSRYRIDTEKATTGVWATFRDQGLSDGEKPIEVRIVRANDPTLAEEIQKAIRPHRDKMQQVDEDGESLWTETLRRKVIAPVVARHLIKDWRNVQDDEGNTIPYSPEAALSILRDPELEDLYTWIMMISGDSELYRKEQAQAALGNSSSGSGGTTDTPPSRISSTSGPQTKETD